MRYVCLDCGEADMWKEGEVAKHHVHYNYGISDTGHSDGSDETAFPVKNGESSSGPRPRSESTSTHASRDSIQTYDGAGAIATPGSPRGYELCPSCIELHGLEHSKSAIARSSKDMRTGPRHTFREKIWGPQGWQDVGK